MQLVLCNTLIANLMVDMTMTNALLSDNDVHNPAYYVQISQMFVKLKMLIYLQHSHIGHRFQVHVE